MGKSIIVNKSRMLEVLDGLSSANDMVRLRGGLVRLKKALASPSDDRDGLVNVDSNGDTIVLAYKHLLAQITQIEETHTIERAKHYLRRFEESIFSTKTSSINDINLNRWKEYDNILTESLWVLQKRDSTGLHSSWYWGNFIPQIPHQLMLRYTKKGDWVVDTFAGSGTTLLECQRLGRNGLGVELQSKVATKTKELLKRGWHSEAEDLFTIPQKQNGQAEKVKTIIEVGDSAEFDFEKALKKQGAKAAQLLIMHPPYHDIIKFSEDPEDLSNAKSTENFLNMFGKIVDNTYDVLEKGRYLGVVIGDKYSKGEWIPLGFRVMDEVLKRGYMLKSIIVKNFEETTAKRNQKELWRYRALVGGFYIFKHEYIMVFRKK